MSDEPRYRDGDWLREQYIGCERTCEEIAQECGCGITTVYRWLKKHDIKTRTCGGYSRDKKYRNEKWLRQQYIEKGKTTIEIANEYGCADATILDWLNRHGIETRNSETRERIKREQAPDSRLTDQKWLSEKYKKERLDIIEIASECDCSRDAVSNWLDKHDIETHGQGQRAADSRLRSRSWLRQQYIDKKKNAHQIAHTCDCSYYTVLSWLNKHDIETRDPNEGGENNPNWKGGPAVYGPGWNKQKRQTVRERDDHTCQDPRCSVTQEDHLDEYGEKLHVHHLRKAREVDDPERRNAKENLITLCRDCHKRWEKIADAGLVPQMGVADD